MRNLVACTYILGAAMTMAGVFHAYTRARRQKGALDSIKLQSDALAEPTPSSSTTPPRGKILPERMV